MHVLNEKVNIFARVFADKRQKRVLLRYVCSSYYTFAFCNISYKIDFTTCRRDAQEAIVKTGNGTNYPTLHHTATVVQKQKQKQKQLLEWLHS